MVTMLAAHGIRSVVVTGVAGLQDPALEWMEGLEIRVDEADAAAARVAEQRGGPGW